MRRQRLDDAFLGTGCGPRQRLRLPAVAGRSEIPSDVGGQQLPGLARMPGDEREEGGWFRERGRRIVQIDVEVVELAQLELVGPVVRPAARAVGSGCVLMPLPAVHVKQVLADVDRGAVGPANDDRYHVLRSGAGGRIGIDL